MSLKLLVNNKEIWDAFNREIDERISSSHRQMEQAQTSEELFRQQGHVAALRKLKQLRDKVNGLDK